VGVGMKRAPNLARLAIRGEGYIVTQLMPRVMCTMCSTAPPTAIEQQPMAAPEGDFAQTVVVYWYEQPGVLTEGVCRRRR
jgi:hypothetical protein